MVTEHRREEDVTEGVLGIVVAHGDLLEHDVAFDFDVVAGTPTAQYDVGHQVDRQLEIGVKHVGVVAGVLAGGERVQFTAHGIHGLRDLNRRPGRRRLEQKVFQEVGGAGHALTFVA